MLEPKKDMKKRLGHSPDRGDALALALAHRTAYKRAFTPTKKAPERVTVPEDDIRWQSYQDDKTNRAERRVTRKKDFYE